MGDVVFKSKRIFIHITLLLVCSMNAHSQQAFEKLVMPGPLVAKHADYEKDCGKCHQPFSKIKQTELCLDCHKEIAEDLDNLTGYHGRSGEFKQVECSHCHTDHEGRDADIVLLNELFFDHEQTDFSLHGAHQEIACEICHEPNTLRSKTPSKCVTCHEQVEPHNGVLGNDCTDCHTEDAWTEIEFDHDKTKFKLEGVHQETTCVACHGYDDYKNMATGCASCHALNDVHTGRLGEKCDECHNEKSWSEQDFNHAAEADFPLRGKHSKIPCVACHKDNTYKDTLSKTCTGCHEADDTHSGHNGRKCASCHSESTWKKITFNHGRDTSFRLVGVHQKLACVSCHIQPAAEVELKQRCVDCHQADDIHAGSLGEKCSDCHDSTRWKLAKFDHDSATKFPLVGQHEKLECTSCHLPDVPSMKIDTECISCHRGDDAHDGDSGERCERCHSENSWSASVVFDHDVTRFPLVGLHSVASCEQCHTDGSYGKLSVTCAECHADSDPHRGNLGRDCESCHTPNDWFVWQFDHEMQTDFPLTGQHDGLDCLACHTEPLISSGNLRDDCFSCHRLDDEHRGAFGRDCERCHSTESFSDMEIIR